MRGLPAWQVTSTHALPLPLPWQLDAHLGGPTTVLVVGCDNLLNRLAHMAKSSASKGFCPPKGHYAQPNGLPTFHPHASIPAGTLWLLADPGVTHHRAQHNIKAKWSTNLSHDVHEGDWVPALAQQRRDGLIEDLLR